MQTENLIDIFQTKIESSADRQVARVIGKTLVGRLNSSALWFAETALKRETQAMNKPEHEEVPSIDDLNEKLATEDHDDARDAALQEMGLVPPEHPRVTMEKTVRLRGYIQACLQEVARPMAFGIPSPYDVGMAFERSYDFQTALQASNVKALGFEISTEMATLVSALRIRSDGPRAKAMQLLAEQLAPTIGLPVEAIMKRLGEASLEQVRRRIENRAQILDMVNGVTGSCDDITATELFDSFPAVRQYRLWVRTIEGVVKERLRIADMVLLGKLPMTHEAFGEMPLLLDAARELSAKLVIRTNEPAFMREIQESIERGATIPTAPVIHTEVKKEAA